LTLLQEIKSDLYRYNGKKSFSEFFKNFFLNRGFKIMLLFRIAKKLNKIPFIGFVIHLYYKRICNRYTIDIPIKTNIGYGIYIGHPFSIAISRDCIIGNNVNISHNATLGFKHGGDKQGSPTIKNHVYIGPNSTILGKIIINSNVVVGANSVVIEDIPDKAVVAGAPTKILSYNGSSNVINNSFHP